MPPRGPEEVQVKHAAQCLPRAEPVGSGRCDDDFLGTGHVRRKLECLPGKHSINLCHGPIVVKKNSCAGAPASFVTRQLA